MKGSFFIDGKECEIIDCFTNEGNNYILYTDGTLSSNNKLEVYTNKFTLDSNNQITLLPISDEEWNIIDTKWRKENE